MTSQERLRESVVTVARAMRSLGLSQGTSGNVSARAGDGMVVTPSALPYDVMEPRDAVHVDLAGRVLEGHRKPTTEWPMHAAIYRARPDIDAVVHTHAPFCTTLATLRRGIPAFHYMVAMAGGDSIRCAPYATFGTPELARAAVKALQDRRACLLANHGMVALGSSPEAALDLAAEVETLAQIYWRAIQVEEPPRLGTEEMAEAMEQFKTYR